MVENGGIQYRFERTHLNQNIKSLAWSFIWSDIIIYSNYERSESFRSHDSLVFGAIRFALGMARLPRIGVVGPPGPKLPPKLWEPVGSFDHGTIWRPVIEVNLEKRFPVLVGGDWNMTFIFPEILGMSSSQLTFIFLRGVETTNQSHVENMVHEKSIKGDV